jgi:hypothetical protein
LWYPFVAHYHHKEKDHDSISELESDNAVSQTEDHFAIEKEDQVDEDHKKVHQDRSFQIHAAGLELFLLLEKGERLWP